MPTKSFKQFCRKAMTFELSVVRVGDDLPDLRDYVSVEVTLDKEDPNKVLLKFRGNEDSGDDEGGRHRKPPGSRTVTTV